MELKDKNKTWRFTFTSTEKGVKRFKYNPIDWENTEYALIREDKGGIMFTFSGDYTYQKDAYTYLKDGISTYGTLWNCFLTIEHKNNYTLQYDTFVSLKKLDFSRIVESDSEKGLTFNIPLTDSGFHEKLQTREDEEIPYSRLETLDGQTITPFANEYEDVTVYGIEVVTEANGEFDVVRLQDPISGFVDHFWPKITLESSNNYIYNTLQASSCDDTQADSTVFSYYANGVDAIVSLRIVLSYFYDTPNTSHPPTTFSVKKVRKLPDGETNIWGGDTEIATITTLFSQTAYVVTGGVPVYNNIDLDQDFTVESGYGLYFQFSRVEGSCLGGYMEIVSNTTTEMTISEKAPVTVLQHVSAMQVHQRLIESITGQSDSFVSTVFDTGGKWEHIYFSNGYLYRQFTTEEAQLAFTWKDLTDNMRKYLNVEYGIVEVGGVKKVICEDRSYYYQQTVGHIITETKRNSMVRELDSKLMYSSIKVGTKKKDYEEIGTLKSYANLCSYSTCLSNYKNELDLETTYFVDPYFMEAARRLPKDTNETTDSQYDNEIIILETIDDGGLVQRTDEDFYSISGIDEITTPMNLNLTPARCLYRYGAWVGIGLQKNLDKMIKFNHSEILTTLATVRSDESITVSENSDIDPNNLEAPFLTGYIIKNMVDATMERISLVEADPYKLIQFPNTIDGGNSQIFLNSLSNKPIGDSLTNIEGHESAVGVIPTAKYWEWNDGDTIDWNDDTGIELNF